jgi:hypothetical protein
MASVPNWITSAVVYGSTGASVDVQPVLSYRATKTQVIVTVQGSRGRVELRFRLKSLREVGSGDYSPRRLLPSDDPRVVGASRRMKMDRARSDAHVAVVLARLQDSTADLDLLVTKLSAIRDAATKALAALAEVD